MAKFKFVQLGKMIEEANVQALNRAAKSAVTAASRFIREGYNFKKSVLDKHLKIVKSADKSNPVVNVRVTNDEIGLIHFGAKQIGKGGRPKKGKGPRTNQGVKAEVSRGKRRLFRSSDNTRGSFIAKIRGAEQVFIRTDEKNSKSVAKLKKLFGVSLTQLFKPKSGSSQVEEVLQQSFRENYEKRLEHELSRRFR